MLLSLTKCEVGDVGVPAETAGFVDVVFRGCGVSAVVKADVGGEGPAFGDKEVADELVAGIDGLPEVLEMVMVTSWLTK